MSIQDEAIRRAQHSAYLGETTTSERVAVVGLGKLGAAYAAVLASAGHYVVGVELNEYIVKSCQQGMYLTPEPGVGEMIEHAFEEGRFTATTDVKTGAAMSDFVFIVVPTPSRSSGRFDTSIVEDVVAKIAETLVDRDRPLTVVVVSTVMPGTMGVLSKILGSATELYYCPLFISLGEVVTGITNPALTLVGSNHPVVEQKLHRFLGLLHSYSEWGQLACTTAINAELAKIALNSALSAKIAYSAMVSEVCQKVRGADAQVVLRIVGSDPRIGRALLAPGGPASGPCIPRDLRAWSAITSDVQNTLPLAIDAVHHAQTERYVDLVNHVARHGRVGIWGLTYKLGVPVYDDSLGIRLAKALCGRGHQVRVFDEFMAWPSEAVRNCKIVDTLAELYQRSDVVVNCLPQHFPDGFQPPDLSQTIDIWGVLSPDVPGLLRPFEGPQ